MSPETARPPLPDWQLERYRLGELPAEQGDTVVRALDEDPAVQKRLAALERDDAEILEHYSPHQVAAEVRARLDRPAPSARAPLLRPVAGLALGAAAVMAWLAVLAPPASVRPQPATGVKGLTPHLLVFRQRSTPASVERLLPGTTARHHDLVQLAYQAAGRRYGVIVSIDGRGLVTRHLPERGPQAVPLKPGPVALPQSYELDDAPAFECFYLVAADTPFAVDSVVAAVQRRHARPGGAGGEAVLLDLPPSMDQSTFVLKKESVR